MGLLDRYSCPKCKVKSSVIHCRLNGRVVSPKCNWRICTKCGEGKTVVVFSKKERYFTWDAKHYDNG